MKDIARCKECGAPAVVNVWHLPRNPLVPKERWRRGIKRMELSIRCDRSSGCGCWNDPVKLEFAMDGKSTFHLDDPVHEYLLATGKYEAAINEWNKRQEGLA